MTRWQRAGLAIALASASMTALADDVRCSAGTSWQVLGSGGPELNRRAQSGHVLWIDGKSRAIFDAGAGTAAHFGEADGNIDDVDLIALTHLHTDHSVDLPAYIKASFFTERTRELPLLGPAAGNGFPSIAQYVDALFVQPGAAYAYLGDFARPGEGRYHLAARTLNLREGEIAVVFKNAAITVRATPVHHGPVPALAYRVETQGHVIVYLGDTDAKAPALRQLADHADLLIANMAIPEDTDDAVALNLHAPPSRIAALARQAQVKRLLLSHWMRRSEAQMTQIEKVIAATYKGPVVVAHDGLCLGLGK